VSQEIDVETLREAPSRKAAEWTPRREGGGETYALTPRRPLSGSAFGVSLGV
jgi:hypothetical protein